MNYKEAGVDVEAGYEAVNLMKKHVKNTFTEGVITDIGGFGGLFSLGKNLTMEEPCLVSGTDGVGTKLKLAFAMDQHDTIGIDCVAMCVNDIVCSGARPLFFLDYIACGKNHPEKIANIVKGISTGCVETKMALIGGETAEMPGFYPEDEYDLAGFAVGIVDKANIIDGSKIKATDKLIGLPSSGIHSNGYSLVRKVFDLSSESLNESYDVLACTLGEELLKPTKLYVKAIKAIQDKGLEIKGISHITGGGFYENIPRMLPDGVQAMVNKEAWTVPAIFDLIKEKGSISEKDMFSTFNMGIGMVLAVDEKNANAIMEVLCENGETPCLLGSLENGEEGIVLC